MQIEKIRENIIKGFYDISRHAEEERQADSLEIQDMKMVLLTGKIIENYPEDPRGPSCLVLGHCGGIPIHIVCGEYPSGRTIIITIYRPDPKLWDKSFEKRRNKQ